MLKPLVLLTTISCGSWLGWYCGSPGGLMGSYLAAVSGASIGLYIGRQVQRNMAGD